MVILNLLSSICYLQAVPPCPSVSSVVGNPGTLQKHGQQCTVILEEWDKLRDIVKVTLALLAYNEEAVIERVVREAAADLARCFEPDTWELLVINDGSRDAT